MSSKKASGKKGSGKKRKNRRLFVVALLAIVVAEVGYISAFILPALETRSPATTTQKFNSLALMEETLINISSTQPTLVNPLPYVNRTTLIYVTIPSSSGCSVPVAALNSLAHRGYGVILVLMNPYSLQPIFAGSQLVTAINDMQLQCGSSPSPGVLLASAYWVTPTAGQLPIGLINATQPLVSININDLNAYMPLAIASYGNGTVKGFIYGSRALNGTAIQQLVNN